MNSRLVNKVSCFDQFKEILDRPIKFKKIYKIMSKNDFEQSKMKNYIYFNRLDEYEDEYDGMQLQLDRPGNTAAYFENNSKYDWEKALDDFRKSTFACCFSTVKNLKLKNEYGSNDGSGKIILTINLEKFLMTIKDLQSEVELPFEERLYLSFNKIKYLNWCKTKLNKIQLLNPIKYAYIKDKKEWKKEKEFRLVLSPNFLAIPTYNLYNSLWLEYDFNKAIKNNVIEKIEDL